MTFWPKALRKASTERSGNACSELDDLRPCGSAVAEISATFTGRKPGTLGDVTWDCAGLDTASREGFVSHRALRCRRT